MQPFSLKLSSRGYECDTSGTVSIAHILSYCEHQRWETMREPELGLVEAVHDGHFFVVLEQHIERLCSFGMSVPLRIEMVLDQVGRSSVWVRHALVRESDNRLLAIAKVRGAWLGPNRRLARIPGRLRDVAQLQAGVPFHEHAGEHGTGGTEGSWFDPPTKSREAQGMLAPPAVADGPIVEQRTVRHRDTDVFGHLNAATWLRFFEDAATPEHHSWRASLKYIREALPGDHLDMHVVHIDGVAWCAATRDGELLATATIEATS
ncbi:MAG: acyl-[acyl-carrier-protein] thioesterase [Proteobacteria bacterium]|nr:acyl-[acyl-carrier-protein] thioesterase [Pseudomonadota bacterium]